jgi:mono/diheme cytochrome c family protein
MKKMMVFILLFSLGLVVIVACQAGAPTESLPEEYTGLENPFAGDEDVTAGMDIYTERCERCHGPDARGEGSAPDLVASADEHNADYLFYWVSTGGDSLTMPSFSSVLSEDQIWQVITYITQLD